MKLIKYLAKGLALAGLVGASVAGATAYQWTGTPSGTTMGAGGLGGNSDPLSSLYLCYDDYSQALTVRAKWTVNSTDGAPEGAWLVLSDGAMPRTAPNETPIYYIDWKSGVNRVTAYSYDGSVLDGGGQYFGSIDNAITVSNPTSTTQQISFTLNLASVNAYDANGSAAGVGGWKGGDFASNVGVWFHWFDQNAANQITYQAGGTAGQYKVANVGKVNESWYDTSGAGNVTQTCNPSCSPSTTPCGTAGAAPGFGGCCPVGSTATSSGGCTTTTTCPTGQTPNGSGGCCPAGSSPNGSGGCTTGGRVPLPSLPLLLGAGLLGLGLARRNAFLK
jgi:hypothetical protein